jgi:hypothetical protein
MNNGSIEIVVLEWLRVAMFIGVSLVGIVGASGVGT